MSEIVSVIPAVFVTKRRWFGEDVVECIQPSKAITSDGTVFDMGPDGAWYKCPNLIPINGKFNITGETIRRVNREFANLVRDGEFNDEGALTKQIDSVNDLITERKQSE